MYAVPAVDERQRAELGHLPDGPQRPPPAAALANGDGRDPVHHQTSERRQEPVLVLELPAADRVEHDVAFALENLGLTEPAMRRRVEEALDALGIAHLRDRSPSTLSGGERQRAAIAGALATGPQVLVLDEPTSQLDPQGAEDVLAALTRLNADLGTTVLLAEHRLERAAPLADRAVVVVAGGRIGDGPGAVGGVVGRYPGAPSVTRLGRALGWADLPLTVRDARSTANRLGVHLDAPSHPQPTRGPALRTARGLRVEVGRREVLHGVDLEVAAGDVVALLGRNGAGKTTLLRTLAGLVAPSAGAVEGSARTAYVPQDPGTLLFAPTVREEVAETLRLLGRPRDEGAIECWLESLGLGAVATRHPRSLSGGERQRVSIAREKVAAGSLPRVRQVAYVVQRAHKPAALARPGMRWPPSWWP